MSNTAIWLQVASPKAYFIIPMPEDQTIQTSKPHISSYKNNLFKNKDYSYEV